MHKPLSKMFYRASTGLRFVDPPPPNPETPPAPGTGGVPPADPPPADEKKLTQTEVNAIAAREKAQGKAAAEQAIATQLGVSITEAAEIVKKALAADEATKTEAQKDRDAAAKEKQDAEAEKTAAKLETHQARLERAFGKEGFDLDGTKDDEKAKAARLLRMVTVEPGASYDEVLADVQQIKKDFPGLFEATSTTRKPPAGDPPGTPPKSTPGEDKFKAGADRAKARYAQSSWDPLNPTGKK